MSLRTLFIRATVMMAVATTLIFVSPVLAAPHTQESPQENIDEVVVTSATTFTLTVMIDEVTTVAIPVQVDWRAEGPTEGSTDTVTVTVSPTVLRTGFFSVTVGSVEPALGALAITRRQPVAEPVAETAPITETATTTATTGATTVTTPTVPSTTTADTPPANEPVGEAPAVNGATTNTISNLRAGPGTEYDIVGSADAGATLDIIGQNSDGTWLALANGAWVATFLVDNVPADLPIIEPATLPTPTPAAPNILTPTATPTP